eukprot:764171-Hanusia_phi.AAC.16
MIHAKNGSIFVICDGLMKKKCKVKIIRQYRDDMIVEKAQRFSFRSLQEQASSRRVENCTSSMLLDI